MTSAEKNGKSFSMRAAEIREQVRAANENLARLVEKSSVDPFSSATRSLIDKLMLVSTIGAVIATVGVVRPEVDLGPFKIDVHVVKFIPVFIAITIVFYGASVLSLATVEIQKWWATHRLSAATLQPITAVIDAAMTENRRIFKEQADLINEMIAAGEDVGELDKDNVALILKKAAADSDTRTEILKRELAKALQPLKRVRKQFAIGLAICDPAAYVRWLVYLPSHLLNYSRLSCSVVYLTFATAAQGNARRGRERGPRGDVWRLELRGPQPQDRSRLGKGAYGSRRSGHPGWHLGAPVG